MNWDSNALRIPLSEIQQEEQYGNPDWLLAKWTPRFRTSKRAIDVIVATPLLVLSAPIILVLCALIRLDSKGSAIYSQRRLGLNGSHFTIYKLRSMRQDAEVAGASYAEANDPRVTRIGKWLRKTRLDEIPQLWNVVRGDMSIIGPRPERPENEQMLEDAIPGFHLRTAIRPGLTGWAQICAPYANTVEQSGRKLEYDIYYIRHASLMLDFRIAVKTLEVMIRLGGH